MLDLEDLVIGEEGGIADAVLERHVSRSNPSTDTRSNHYGL